MYVEREHASWDDGMHLPPEGYKGAMCVSRSPESNWICTREENHGGPHRAGIDACTWAAEWDDDRSTDPAGTDFFAEIGL